MFIVMLHVKVLHDLLNTDMVSSRLSLRNMPTDVS